MSATDTKATIAVPCYNEAARIDEDAFLAFSRTRGLRVVFVDDGSTDATADVLARMSEASGTVEVLTLSANTGKAEAVRRGLRYAIGSGAALVGYWDADLATPPRELRRLVQALEERPDLEGVLGCRLARMGSVIERSPWRHYLGRLYASAASIALGITVYDTQCGAKVFRVSDGLVEALSVPFRTSWSFDVELLDRLLRGAPGVPGIEPGAFAEIPLEAWHDVGGSKLGVASACRAFVDLVAIGVRGRRAARRLTRERGTGTAPRLRQLRGGSPQRDDPAGPGDRREFLSD